MMRKFIYLLISVCGILGCSWNLPPVEHYKSCSHPQSITKTADVSDPLKITLGLNSIIDVASVTWRIIDATTNVEVYHQAVTVTTGAVSVSLTKRGNKYNLFADIVSTCGETFSLTDTYSTVSCGQLTNSDITFTADPVNPLKFKLTLPTASTEITKIVWKVNNDSITVKKSDSLTITNNTFSVVFPGGGNYSVTASIKTICSNTYSLTITKTIAPISILYFISFDHHIYAINAETSAKIWSADVASPDFASPTVSEDGTVYVGSDKVYAFDAYSGEVKWTFTAPESLDAFICSPIVAAGQVYIGSVNGYFYKLDAKLGTKTWVKKVASLGIQASPSLFLGIIFIGSLDHNFYAIPDLPSSVPTILFTAGNEIKQKSYILDGVAFVGSSDQYVYAWDITNNKMKWKVATGIGVLSSPTVAFGNVWTTNTALYGYDKNFGSQNYYYLPPPSGSNIESSPVVYQSNKDQTNRVYFGCENGSLYSYDFLQKIAISQATGGEIHSSPLAVNDIIYVGSYDGKLWALDATTLGVKWTFLTQDKIFSSPCLLGKDRKVYHSGITGQNRF